jgi:hypothetical protein
VHAAGRKPAPDSGRSGEILKHLTAAETAACRAAACGATPLETAAPAVDAAAVSLVLATCFSLSISCEQQRSKLSDRQHQWHPGRDNLRDIDRHRQNLNWQLKIMRISIIMMQKCVNGAISCSNAYATHLRSFDARLNVVLHLLQLAGDSA